ncbi:MAG: ferritin [Deltaproteobacteria bacterium]|nr:ferritin [Deltaproteobacteria bacterium]
MEAALNQQINAEYYSSYLYLSMAAYFESLSLPGCANWMRVQAQEELMHALKFFDFVAERGGRIALTAIEAPETEWKSPLDCFQAVYKHEQHVTSLIHGLVDLARELRDHPADNLLQWFVAEQVEEEASADKVVQDLRRAGDSAQLLMMIDRELAQRVFTPPATGSGT